MNRKEALPYLLAFLALLYLASPHVYECYQAYARPWETNENKVTEKTVEDEEIEHMTNADVANKLDFHADKDNQVWEMFTETEVKPKTILPGVAKPSASKTILPGVPTPSGSKTILPGVPTPSGSKSILPGVPTPSGSKSILPGVPTPESSNSEPKQERANIRIMDKEVQKPMMSPRPPPPRKSEPPPKAPLSRPTPKPTPHHPEQPLEGKEIWGPLAPKLDPNQPSPSDSGNGKHGSGVYPHIYGPDLLDAPGSKDKEDSIDIPEYDYLPAAEFPAGPLQPSPYLNDFSKILKT
jgi:hypothetical protein